MTYQECVNRTGNMCIHASYSFDGKVWTCPYITATGDCGLSVYGNQSRRYIK